MSFTRRIENFACEHCDQSVTGTGYTNHCPVCLWSKHVDVDPGDRAASCLGLMKPVASRLIRDEFEILHVCISCGHRRSNRASREDAKSVLMELSRSPWID